MRSNLASAKETMLRDHLARRGISNRRVLAAFQEVPREEFIPTRLYDLAYEDMPLEIGSGQTISQPYTVAFMTQILDPQPDETVLEIGTGSGYQSAILSRLVKRVYTIERLAALAKSAGKRLRKLRYDNVQVSVGDGSRGLLEKAPFAGIIVTAAAPRIPPPLLSQLKIGGRLVIPVGEGMQEMKRIVKNEKGLKEENYPGFRFVPLIGKEGFADD